jgi:hypothetical protein
LTGKYDPSLPLIAVDTETALFSRGEMAPQLTCVSFAQREGGRIKTELLNHVDGVRKVKRLLEGGACITGQNFPYDVAVFVREAPELLPLFFDAYEAGRIHDTQHAEWVNDTALGILRSEWDEEKGEYVNKKSYALENLARIHLSAMPYKDEWRLRYAELRGVPISAYPEPARKYPQLDARYTLEVAECQRDIAARIQPHDPLAASLAHVSRTYLALHLVAIWGQEIDWSRARQFEQLVREYAATFIPDMEDAGLLVRTLRGKNKGKLTEKKAPLQELVARAHIENDEIAVFDALMPLEECLSALLTSPADYLDDDFLTDGGKSGNRQIKCAASVLKDLALHDYADPTTNKLLKKVAGFKEAKKLHGSFALPLKKFGAGPTHSRYGFAETGRTTCSGGPKKNRTGLNDQQLPRKNPKALVKFMMERIGFEIDARSCYVARKGWVKSSIDYNSLEMRTFAQACIWLVGYSTLGEALNAGLDPHTIFAADLVNASYEDVLAAIEAGEEDAKDARQRAKVANFGYPGGMGARKFLRYAKQQDIVMTLNESKRLRERYLARWVEANDYFALMGNEVGEGEATYVGIASGFLSGGCRYTDLCNRNFQELAAFGATSALWRYVRECYDERCNSALFGSRVNAFIHDEIIGEHPEEVAHEAAERGAAIMIETMQGITPDIDSEAEPALMRRWYKGAKTVRDKHKRLVPWEPERKAA